MHEDNFSINYARNVFIRIPLVAIVLALIGFLIFRFSLPILLGVLVGSAISMLNFWLQVRYVKSIVFMEKPQRFIFGSLIRLGVTAAAFIAAMIYPQWLNIFAVFVGVMLAPMIILVYRRRQPAVKGGREHNESHADDSKRRSHNR
ncbi:MAG: ATP synthase subunit I [Culicoidibacterales bacterium]